MGFMWIINNKVIVNCQKNYENGKRLTLVDNKQGEVHDFSVSTDVLKYLLENGFTGVENYIDELVAEKLNKEKENRKWKNYNFYVKKSNAPYIINKIDSSAHVKSWEITDEDMFRDEGMVRIEYVADKRVLFQTENDVIIKED